MLKKYDIMQSLLKKSDILQYSGDGRHRAIRGAQEEWHFATFLRRMTLCNIPEAGNIVQYSWEPWATLCNITEKGNIVQYSWDGRHWAIPGGSRRVDILQYSWGGRHCAIFVRRATPCNIPANRGRHCKWRQKSQGWVDRMVLCMGLVGTPRCTVWTGRHVDKNVMYGLESTSRKLCMGYNALPGSYVWATKHVQEVMYGLQSTSRKLNMGYKACPVSYIWATKHVQ